MTLDGKRRVCSINRTTSFTKLWMVLLLLMLVCLCLLCGCSGQTFVTENDENEEKSAMAMSEGIEGSYPLSRWTSFNEYWERTSEDDGVYSEVDQDGDIAYYRLRDGYEPGSGVERATVLYGATRSASGEDGDIVVVDCSTGEVGHWILGEAMGETLESDDADKDSLAANGIYKEESGWLAYVNIPQPRGNNNEVVEVPLGAFTIGETAEMWMNKMPDDGKKIVLEHSPELREYLIEHYGEEVVAPYED